METCTRRQLRIMTIQKCKGKDFLGIIEAVWEKRKSVRLVCDINVTRQKEANIRRQRL